MKKNSNSSNSTGSSSGSSSGNDGNIGNLGNGEMNSVVMDNTMVVEDTSTTDITTTPTTTITTTNNATDGTLNPYLPSHAITNIAYARPPLSITQLKSTPKAPWSMYLGNTMKMPWLVKMCWEAIFQIPQPTCLYYHI